MKRFQFSLETVLDYRQQVLDAVKVEHGAILAQLHRQEEVVADAQRRYAELNEEFCQAKMSGVTIAGAMAYQVGLQVIEREIAREQDKLKTIIRQEEEKREELIESRVDAASLEMLRERRLDEYNKEVQKGEERMIDELVGGRHARAPVGAM